MPGSADRIEWPAGDRAARVLGASGRARPALVRAGLAVLAKLYAVGVRGRNALYDRGVVRKHRVTVPVISVGNIVAGGAGKTPFTRWLADRISARRKSVAVLHGGYAPDEPALHREWRSAALVYEERDRVKAAGRAIAAGADVIILDDAFQHRRLARDLDIVLIPAESTSRELLPLGPLREAESSLARADLLVVTRKTAPRADARELARRLHEQYATPVAVVSIELERPDSIPERAVIVTAIARPELFLAQARKLGIVIVRTLAYPDHHEYSGQDVEHILSVAGDNDIVCTEKDAVKLRRLLDPARLRVLRQTLLVEEGEGVLMAMLERVL